MSEEIRQRQLGHGHDEALAGFRQALEHWVLPFLQKWMSAGPQPIVSDEEESNICAAIDSWRERPPPPGYAWLPDLLKKLAKSLRFNRQNLVNIHPAPHVPAVLASTLVSLQNPNNIVKDVSKPTSLLEEESIAWMAKHLIGFPDGAWGNLVSGGTIANLTALLVARDYSYRKLGRPRPIDVRTRGLHGLPAGVVLATAGSHYSIAKALWVLGMGDENVVRIPVCFDDDVRKKAQRDVTFINGITDRTWRDRLDKAIEQDMAQGSTELTDFYEGKPQPFSLQPLNSEIYKALYSCFTYGTPLIAYVFTIGTTDTGTVECPDTEALELLHKEDVYIHADAASGGFALLHPQIRELVNKQHLAGLAQVDSVTLDGHKLGHLAYPNAAVIFREHGWKHEILHEAPYLKDLAPTVEGSRSGAPAAALWAAKQDMDEARYRAWLDRLLAFIKHLVQALTDTGRFQVLHKVHLTTVALAPLPQANECRSDVNELVKTMHRLIQADHSPRAFLINIDSGLAGIKVRERRDSPEGSELVDIVCLRLVATNPSVETEDALKLVAYLDEHLAKARGAGASQQEIHGQGVHKDAGR